MPPASDWRVFTVPNALTALRLVCLPAFLALLAEPHGEGRLAAAFLLGALGITDGMDGYIARHFDQGSLLGKLADPFVDRVLILSAAVGAIAVGAAPVWLVAVALLREGLVLATAGVLALAGARRMDVSWPGKAGAFGMMVAFPLFFLGHAAFRWHSGAEVLAWVAASGGLAFGWFAVVGYVPQARAALSEGRSARRLAGKGRAGKEVAGKEVAGKEVAGKEVAGKEVAGKEVAGNPAGKGAAE